MKTIINFFPNEFLDKILLKMPGAIKFVTEILFWRKIGDRFMLREFEHKLANFYMGSNDPYKFDGLEADEITILQTISRKNINNEKIVIF